METRVCYIIAKGNDPLFRHYWDGKTWIRSIEYSRTYSTRNNAARAVKRAGLSLPDQFLVAVEVEITGIDYPLQIVKVIS